MITNKLKTSILASLSFMMFSNVSYADQYTDLHKQLTIMTKILKTTAKQETTKKSPKILTIDSTYLKGQGIVFTIKTGSRFFNFSRYNFVMPELAEIPELPEIPEAPNVEIEYQNNINETVNDAMENASRSWEIAIENSNEAREASRQLRDQQRDLNAQQRDIDRQLRDLRYQATHADKATEKALAKQRKALTEKSNKLKIARKKLSTQTKKIKAKQQAEQKQQQLNQQKYYQSLAQLISETFCSYGNALKALPKNEKISVILTGAAHVESQGKASDKIYVFEKKNVLDCVVDNINAKTLLNKSVHYNF